MRSERPGSTSPEQRLKVRCRSNFDSQRFELSVKRQHNKVSSFSLEEDHNANRLVRLKKLEERKSERFRLN